MYTRSKSQALSTVKKTLLSYCIQGALSFCVSSVYICILDLNPRLYVYICILDLNPRLYQGQREIKSLEVQNSYQLLHPRSSQLWFVLYIAVDLIQTNPKPCTIKPWVVQESSFKTMCKATFFFWKIQFFIFYYFCQVGTSPPYLTHIFFC